MARRKRGIETYDSLASWYYSSADAERMVAQLLITEGFTAVNPSQPLGGPDGLKDVVCLRNGQRWIAAAHFTRGPIQFSATKKKFAADLKGVRKNGTKGFAFFTNRKLTEANRKVLAKLARGALVEIYHLERISADLPPEAGGL